MEEARENYNTALFFTEGIRRLPTQIKLHKKSRTLELSYDSESFELTAEYLRVHSPSAEVRGHGIGNGVLQT
ncbi:MAG: DUF971 domain-containing protein, partial [bacterium]|nr:DUF971 domain-containing protein [bacterium]